MTSDDKSPLRHPLSRRLLSCEIMTMCCTKMTRAEYKARDEIIELCCSIHKKGWNAERMAECQKLIKRYS